MQKINELLDAVEEAFLQVANPEDAEGMKAYMRDKFEFLGLKSQLRKNTQKAFWATYKLPQGEDLKVFIKGLWALPSRELHYMAIELLEKPLKKADDSWMDLLEYLIVTHSWWDTVDAIAAKLVGGYLKKYPKFAATYPEQWIESEDMWLRRTAILYQLKYKKETNTERLFDFILRSAHEKEFFIQKVQGWTLRELAKTNPQIVLDFVAAHENKLSKLTKKEALKHLIILR